MAQLHGISHQIHHFGLVCFDCASPLESFPHGTAAPVSCKRFFAVLKVLIDSLRVFLASIRKYIPDWPVLQGLLHDQVTFTGSRALLKELPALIQMGAAVALNLSYRHCGGCD